MNIGVFETISRLPFIYKGNFYDSKELKQNKCCINKCKQKDCLTLLDTLSPSIAEYNCSKGYNNKLITINNSRIIFNGLIYTNNTQVPFGRKKVRKEWIVKEDTVNLHIKDITKINQYIESSILDGIEKNYSMFHDFKTSMSIIYSCTQDIVDKSVGNTFLEKLENSDKSLKDLYNALELITSQLGMIDVVLNPNSIEFGNKKRINLYRLFEKIKILFGHISTKKQDININIIAEGWVEDCYCHESIEFIPLILIDNALKYSVKDSDVEIKFEQKRNKLKVIVKNIGPLVKYGNEEKIFNKFYRDETAISFAKEGIGMGLWIAQEILKSHNSELHYYKDMKEKRNIGLNIFEFNIETTS